MALRCETRGLSSGIRTKFFSKHLDVLQAENTASVYSRQAKSDERNQRPHEVEKKRGTAMAISSVTDSDKAAVEENLFGRRLGSILRGEVE